MSLYYELLQYEVRLKTIAFGLLKGGKSDWGHSERWVGDELKTNDKFTHEVCVWCIVIQ